MCASSDCKTKRTQAYGSMTDFIAGSTATQAARVSRSNGFTPLRIQSMDVRSPLVRRCAQSRLAQGSLRPKHACVQRLTPHRDRLALRVDETLLALLPHGSSWKRRCQRSLSANPPHEAVCGLSSKTRGSGGKISSSTGSLGSRRDSRDRKTNLTPKRRRLRSKTRPATHFPTGASNTARATAALSSCAPRLNGMIRTVHGRRRASVQQFAGSDATQDHLKCTNIDIKEKTQSTSNYLDTLQGGGESASRASIQTAAQRLSLSHFDVVGHH